MRVEEINVLTLYLCTDKMSWQLLPHPIKVYDNDKEYYFDWLNYVANQVSLLINAIPGLELVVDKSVCEFIEGEEENVRKFVGQLVKEL